MTEALTRTETWSLLVLFGACTAVVVNTLQGDGNPLSASIAFSGLAFTVSFCLIRWLGNTFIKAGLKGKDMSKARRVDMSVTYSRQKPARADRC
jgi:UDP-N-acetylglucosamine--dolichyl-phosphate N-acetylglucosaminephosphotransferase